MSAEGCDKKCVDYLFYCDAKLLTNIDGHLIKSIRNYPYLSNIKLVDNKSEELIITWMLEDTTIISSKLNLKNKKLYLCSSPDNPNIANRTTLLIRAYGSSKVTFNVEWSLETNE